MVTERQPGGTLAEALAAGTVVLDGGLATQLEAMGHDISGDLWSAVLLRDDPDAVRAAHAAFAAAGAQVAISASYQATFDGFAAAGIDHAEAERLIRRSVTLAREALEEATIGSAGATGNVDRTASTGARGNVDRTASTGATGSVGRNGSTSGGWVAGSVGPYGAYLANGEEYTGSYVDPGWPGRTGGGLSVAELARWHLPRMAVLAEAGADVLACETVPAAAEAEALLIALAGLGVPGWLALTTMTGPDGIPRTRRGEPAAEVFALARGVDAVIAVGVNCTDPDGVLPAIQAATAAGKPVVVYPNSGQVWDGTARAWRGEPHFAAADVTAWVAAGARLVGGCCRVGPAQIAALAATVTSIPT